MPLNKRQLTIMWLTENVTYLIHIKPKWNKRSKEWLVAPCSTGILILRRCLLKEVAKINLLKEDKLDVFYSAGDADGTQHTLNFIVRSSCTFFEGNLNTPINILPRHFFLY